MTIPSSPTTGSCSARASLEYQTRDKSGEFLRSINLERRDENIDFWFIANAYETIKNWFEKDLQIRVMHIFEYLKEDVKIIWYEVGESEDAILLFTRLNIGKIPLTSAELVKAMFLSGDGGVCRERQEEVSLQWDKDLPERRQKGCSGEAEDRGSASDRAGVSNGIE